MEYTPNSADNFTKYSSSNEGQTDRENELKELNNGRVEEIVFRESVGNECIGDWLQ